MSGTATANRPAYIQRVGVTEPSLFDTITFQGQTQDMAGATVLFSMRPLLSRTPTLNGVSAAAISPTDEDGRNVRYDWASGDVAVEGDFMGWWRFTLPGSTAQETPEFPILITDHGPGEGVKTGLIVDGVSAYMPSTFSALRRSQDFGDRRLQRIATMIQLRVSGSYVDPDLEYQYPLPLLDYYSKRLALELCTPGIDYWSRQPRTVTAQGPTEITAFPDIIAALERLRERLESELADDWRALQLLVPNLVQRKVMALPATSNGDPSKPWLQNYVTRDPNDMPPLMTGQLSSFSVEGSVELAFFPWFP